MNENLKNRIIGASLVIILSIIIAPMLFKGSGKKELKFQKIDNQKDIKFNYIDEVKVLENKNISKVKKISSSVDEKIIKDLDVNVITENNKLKKNSWVIRIGSYLDKTNAEKQIKKLEDIKYQSFIVKSNRNNKTFYSVNVGPYFSSDDVKKNYLKLIKNNQYGNSYIIESIFKK